MTSLIASAYTDWSSHIAIQLESCSGRFIHTLYRSLRSHRIASRYWMLRAYAFPFTSFFWARNFKISAKNINSSLYNDISKQATAATERNIEQLCGTHTNSLSKFFFSIPRQTVWVSKGTIAPLKLPKISHKFRIRSFVCSEWNAIRIHSHIAAKRQIDEFREFDEISAQSDEKVKRYSNEPNR